MKKIVCSLMFLLQASVALAQTPDYENTIKPIIQMSCMPCHTKGNVGAMPLETYQQVKAYGKMLAYVTENKLMPPCKADLNFSDIKNCKSIDEASVEAIKAWLENAMPQGKVVANAKPSQIDSSAKKLKPDMVIAMKEAFTIADDYTERSQVFVIPTALVKDEWIEAIEFVPGNKKLVKSCTISIDTGQTAVIYDGNDLNYGYSSSAGFGFIPSQYNWHQWMADEPQIYFISPYVKRIPTAGKFLLHITYKASKTVQKDSSYIKLQFAKKDKPLKVIESKLLLDTTHIANASFGINAGQKRKFYAVVHLTKQAEIHSVMPAGQAALSSWEVYAIDSASGRRINLLTIPYWDAHWKKKYLLQSPVTLSAGSKIYGTAYYNNSDDNPNLPILPPKKIRYGHGQRDELFAVQFDVVYMSETTK